MNKIALLLLVFSALSCPAVLHATARSAEERRDYYQRGRDALAAKNWDEAARIFKELWTEQHSYDVALSLGEAEFRLNRYRDAAEYLSFAVANMPATEKIDLVQRTTKALDKAKQEIGSLTVLVDQSGANVQLDGKPLGTTPLPSVLFVDAGHHLVEATLPKYESTKTELDIGRGEATAITLKLEPSSDTATVLLPPPDGALSPTPSPSPPANLPAQRAGGSGKTIALIAGGAVTAVALTTTIIFAVKRSSAQNDVSDLQNQIRQTGPAACSGFQAPVTNCQELERRYADMNDAQHVVNVALPVTIVAAAGTALMYFVWPHHSAQESARPTLAPLVAGGTGGLLISGQF